MRKRLINARNVWFWFGGVFFGIGKSLFGARRHFHRGRVDLFAPSAAQRRGGDGGRDEKGNRRHPPEDASQFPPPIRAAEAERFPPTTFRNSATASSTVVLAADASHTYLPLLDANGFYVIPGADPRIVVVDYLTGDPTTSAAVVRSWRLDGTDEADLASCTSHNLNAATALGNPAGGTEFKTGRQR